MGTPGKVAQHAAKGNLFYGDVQLARPRAAPDLPVDPAQIYMLLYLAACSSSNLRESTNHPV